MLDYIEKVWLVNLNNLVSGSNFQIYVTQTHTSMDPLRFSVCV